MRKAICCALLLAFASAHADDSQHYKAWLDFKQAFDKEVSGPTGIYAIQDMVELDAGESAYLSSGDADSFRWVKTAPPTTTAQVQFKDGKALIRGPGIEARDLLHPIGEALALPNGLTIRGTVLREKIAKLWLYNAKLPARKGFKALDYYPYDSRGVITGTFRRNEQPVAMSYLDSREQAGTMYVVGTLQVRIEGETYNLKTYSNRNEWNDIQALLLCCAIALPARRPTAAAAWWTSTFRRGRHRSRSRSTSILRTASCAHTPSTSTARWCSPTIWTWS